MQNNFKKTLITDEQIQKRVKELAREIERDYIGESVVMVCILRGSYIFFADLTREIKNVSVEVDFMAISSYGNSTQSSGEVKVVKDLNARVSGRNVIIVEDIIDSGNTISYLRKLFEQRDPKSLKVCALLDKPDRRTVEAEVDYIGFSIPDEFVVGYGLDYAEKFRNEKEIYILNPEVYTK